MRVGPPKTFGAEALGFVEDSTSCLAMGNNTFIYTQSQRANNNGTSALLSGGTRDERLARGSTPASFRSRIHLRFAMQAGPCPMFATPASIRTISRFQEHLLRRRWAPQLAVPVGDILRFQSTSFRRPEYAGRKTDVGTISSAGGSRQIQMALKLLW